MARDPQTTPDICLLQSALSRVAAAQEWATQAKLLNVGGELRKAASEVRDYLNAMTFRMEDSHD